MFSPNPYLRALSIMSYAGIILGVILLFIPQLGGWALTVLSAGFLSLLGFLIVGGLTWRRQPPAA